MTETPEQRVARLQHELDQAKIDDLQKQLAAAQAAAGMPVPDTSNHTQVQDILEQIKHATAGMNLNIGGDGTLPGVHLGKRSYGAPADGQPLAPPPRKVPWQFKVLVMPWSWWTWFAVLMISVTPIALYIGIPLAGAVASAVGFLVIVILRIRRDRLQLALLKWGAVATVVDAAPVSVGTYYSGTTYQNVRMAQAHGWQVERTVVQRAGHQDEDHLRAERRAQRADPARAALRRRRHPRRHPPSRTRVVYQFVRV